MERGVTHCHSSPVVIIVVIKGEEFDLLTLKATALVNCCITHHCYVIFVNMFLVIKCGHFNDLGESVMCGTDLLLSL